MGKQRSYQTPINLGDAGKRDTRSQFGALCFRRKKSGVEILLLTSRDSGRWIIPKGWPIDGLTPAAAAAQEAWEEAGAKGTVHEGCLGLYSYEKEVEDGRSVPVVVAVFPLEVQRLKDAYPEADDRKRKWLTPKKAASRVAETDLKQILRSFDPATLR